MFLIEYVLNFKSVGSYGFTIKIVNVKTNVLYSNTIKFDTNLFLL